MLTDHGARVSANVIFYKNLIANYSDVIMSAMASQITGVSIVCYEILGGILLICQNATVRVCGARIKIYFVLGSKIYNTHGCLFWTPSGSRQVAGAPAFVKIAYCN